MRSSIKSQLLLLAGLTSLLSIGCEEPSPDQQTKPKLVEITSPQQDQKVNHSRIPIAWNLNHLEAGVEYYCEVRTDKGMNAADNWYEAVIYRETITPTTNTNLTRKITRGVSSWSDTFSIGVVVVDSKGNRNSDVVYPTLTF